MGATRWVEEVMGAGLHLGTVATPAQGRRHNMVRVGGSEAMQATSDEVLRLLSMGAIERATAGHPADWCHPLLVVQKPNGKLRICVDLRELNKQLPPPPKFRMEGVGMLLDLLQPQSWMVSIDIRDGYLQVPVHPESRPLLGICWQGVTYRYTRLPFGLGWAPFVFTKVVRTFVRRARQQGTQMIVYLDDFLFWNRDRQELIRQRDEFVAALLSVGWRRSEKGTWEPAQVIEFLGFSIDSRSSVLKVTEKRLCSMREAVDRALAPASTRRQLATVVGHAVSMAKAAPQALTVIHSAQRLLRQCSPTAREWDGRVLLPPEVVADLRLLRSMVSAWNGANFWRPSLRLVLRTDASSWGWGAVLPQLDMRRGERWSSDESRRHSNVRELDAVLRGLQVFRDQLRHRRVRLESDNSTAVSYVRRWGGRSPALERLAEQVCVQACQLGLQLEAVHIPGQDNAEADAASRGTQHAEWSLKEVVVRRLVERWGPFDVDRFASSERHVCDKYNSRWPDRRASATDAFTQDWGEAQLNLAVPPFALVARAIRHAQECRAKVVLVVPKWESAPWWPVLWTARVDSLPLGRAADICQENLRDPGAPELARNPAWQFLAVKLAPE